MCRGEPLGRIPLVPCETGESSPLIWSQGERPHLNRALIATYAWISCLQKHKLIAVI